MMNKKNITALLLALVMLFTAFPVSVFADEVIAQPVQNERTVIIAEGSTKLFDAIKQIDNTAVLKKDLWIIESISVEVSSNKLAALTEKKINYKIEDTFERVADDAQMLRANETIMEIFETTRGANNIFDGRGKVVAVLDSGTDVKHRDLNDNIIGARLTSADIQKAAVKGKYYSVKVPYAYNYADDNDDIKDTNKKVIGYGHGMHVAGIIVANGPEGDSSRMRGVAPNAQLLSMKIFSNNPLKGDGAAESSVIAAIQDAITLGADAMNLSFTFSSGIQKDDEPMQRAVNIARERGIMVIAAAGNAYYAGYPNKPTIDNSTVGTPAIAKGAVAVAAYESKFRVINKFTCAGKKIQYTALNGDISKISGAALVNGGNGSEEEIPANFGVVIIYRSGLQFLDMIKTAKEKGSRAVIFYNREGDDSYIESVGYVEQDIPVIFVSNTDGKFLLTKLGESPDFAEATEMIDNPLKGMSVFSSYGPIHNLEIKPEVTGIGGTVYSLMNDDKYATMGGTSMASPYVAGIALNYMNYLDSINKKLNPEEIVKVMLNSTNILVNEERGLPYAVRRQGAGMIDFQKMINNEIQLTYNGVAKASIGEIGASGNFVVNVKNVSGKKVSAKVEFSKILTVADDNQEKLAATASISADATAFELDAGQAKDINITLNAGSVLNNFIEGFITVKTETSESSIPYLAFSGDFKNLPVFDENFNSEKSIYKEQGMYSEYKLNDGRFTLVPLGGKNAISEYMSINPDDEHALISAFPKISMLRNARDVKFYVEDSKGKLVTYIFAADFLRKEVTAEQKDNFKLSTDWKWNGRYYDKAQGIKVPASEGQYYFIIEATPIVDGAKTQRLRFPVKIDKTKPVVEAATIITDADICELTINAEDIGAVKTDVSHFVFLINNKGYKEGDASTFELEKSDGVYKKILKLGDIENSIVKVHVGASDYAGNMGVGEATIVCTKNSKLTLTAEKTDIGLNEKASLNYSMSGAASYKIYVNDVTKLVATTTDTHSEIGFDEIGPATVIVEALDASGKSIGVNAVRLKVGVKDLDDGFEITSEKKNDGTFFTTVWNVFNKHKQAKTVTFITCAYSEDNKLLNMVANSIKIDALARDKVENKIKIPAGTKKIINYVWDDFDSLNTISAEDINLIN